MSPEDIQREREAFEQVIRENCDPMRADETLAHDGNNYVEYATLLAYAVWQASRAAQPPIAQQEYETALDLLEHLFDAYEDGVPCYGEPESQGDFFGNAFRLDGETFNKCADLLNVKRPRSPAIAQQAAPAAQQPRQQADLAHAGWRYTLCMEFGQRSVRLTEDRGNAFGEPGRDYSAEYPVIEEELFVAAAQPSKAEAVPIYQTLWRDDSWRDIDVDSYKNAQAIGQTTRIVYTAPPSEPARVEVLDCRACADDIRDAGWTVAVHNDYREHGEPHTFWLFTKGGIAVKGEGRTDADALDEVRAAIAAAPTPKVTG
ncbi:MAG: hypothetical protein ACRYG5_10005 [Janthinobacterium lividum]